MVLDCMHLNMDLEIKMRKIFVSVELILCYINR